MADLSQRIMAHALANALKYDGKAQTGNVLPKILGEFPEQKQRVKELKAEIDAVVAQVNTLSVEDQRERVEELAPELLEKKAVKEKVLPPLPNATVGAVVTRFPPEPSKYLHLGHAMTVLINWIYSQRYEGKMVLRLEDANPEKVTQEYVETIIDDLETYLHVKPQTIRYVSDDMPVLLTYARELIERGGAYMCSCPQEEMRAKREEGTDCACKHRDKATQVQEWEKLIGGGFAAGEAVLRFYGDMQAQNTVMRDPVLWRIVEAPHFRVGTQYRVWPTYDFYNPIEDHLCGVTHVLRDSNFELRVELQEAVKRLLGMSNQTIVQYGRINITGATTKGREIREGIENGTYMGWDDPRLVTLKALKRRGIQREAYYALVEQLGLSKGQISLDFSMLAAANRAIIEPTANRYSFICDPQEITIHGVTPHDVELHLHPDKKEGGRKLHATGKYLIAQADLERIHGKRVRLMGDLTFEEHDGRYKLVSHNVGEGKHELAINWLPADSTQTVAVELMMPDATVRTGVAERTITQLKIGAMVQLERTGFCRLDRIENGTYHFWYAHD